MSPNGRSVFDRELGEENHQRPPQWIDYFAFPRGLYSRNTPPLVIGRPSWDNWLLWKARASGAAVVDASAVILAVHQNHDYAYHPDGKVGVWSGEEAIKRLQTCWRVRGTFTPSKMRRTNLRKADYSATGAMRSVFFKREIERDWALDQALSEEPSVDTISPVPRWATRLRLRHNRRFSPGT